MRKRLQTSITLLPDLKDFARLRHINLSKLLESCLTERRLNEVEASGKLEPIKVNLSRCVFCHKIYKLTRTFAFVFGDGKKIITCCLECLVYKRVDKFNQYIQALLKEYNNALEIMPALEYLAELKQAQAMEGLQ